MLKKWLSTLLILSLILTPIFYPSTVHANAAKLTPPNDLAEFPIHQEQKISLGRKIIEHIRGTRHFKKKQGPQDPHFPVHISIRPKKFTIPNDIGIPAFSPAHPDDSLLIPNLLEQLSLTELKMLLHYLGTQKIKVRYHCRGKWHIHPIHALLWDKMNGAAALALTVGAQQDYNMLARIMATTPEHVLPEMTGKSSSLLSVDVTATTLLEMVKQLDKKNTSKIAISAANLVHIYIKYWAGKDAEKLDQHLNQLVWKVYQKTYSVYQGDLDKFNPKHLGVLLGALVSGTLSHCSKIKSTDEKRQWMVNSASNLIWAATTYLGAVPWFGANVAALISGTISMGVVGSAVVYNGLRAPRDYSSIVRHIQGEIKAFALDSATTPQMEHDSSLLIDWIDTTLELNGQPA